MRNLDRRVHELERATGPAGTAYTFEIPFGHPDPARAKAAACREAGVPLPSDGDFVLVLTRYDDEAQPRLVSSSRGGAPPPP